MNKVSFFGLVVAVGLLGFVLFRPHVALGAADSCHDVDLNGDGVVNIIDLVTIARSFGVRFSPGTYSPNAYWDVSEDGIVNIIDLVAVARYFGESCEVLAAPAQVSDDSGKRRRTDSGSSDSARSRPSEEENRVVREQIWVEGQLVAERVADTRMYRLIRDLDGDEEQRESAATQLVMTGRPAVTPLVLEVLCRDISSRFADESVPMNEVPVGNAGEIIYRIGEFALTDLRAIREDIEDGGADVFPIITHSRPSCGRLISGVISAIEGGGLLDIPEDLWPRVISDSGRVVTLRQARDSSEAVDFLFVPTLYDDTESKEGFFRGLRFIVKFMTEEEEIFRAYKDRMNFRALTESRPLGFGLERECLTEEERGQRVPVLSIGLTCADDELVQEAIRGAEADVVLVMVNWEPTGREAGSGAAFMDSDSFPSRHDVRLVEVFDPKSLFEYAIILYPLPKTVVHELGHLLGRLPDYYRSDPSCALHPSRMCDSALPFSDELLSYDKAKMVKFFNQYTGGIVSQASTPFSRGGAVRIDYTVSYPPGEQPVFVLMEVYDSQGGFVDFVVSDSPQAAGRNTIEWDGKNFQLEPVANGVYFYKIYLSNNITTRGVFLASGTPERFLGDIFDAVLGIFLPMFR